MRSVSGVWGAVLSLVLGVGAAWAEATPVTVRVMAQDGKFIGHAMGGVDILIRDADTGEVLAQGVARGATGDTRVLVGEPRVRGARLSRDGDSQFQATLDITEPRRITIEARGPRFAPAQQAAASTTRWVLPGRPPHGPDGVILELSGLAVDVMTPTVYDRTVRVGDEVTIEANVVLLCGCGLEPGSIWNAAEYEIGYVIVNDGHPHSEGRLTYAGRPSRFNGRFTAARNGTYEIMINAYHPQTGSVGIGRASVVVP